MAAIPHDVQCFDVERGLAKALAIRCETFICRPAEYRIRIGQRWNLVLDAQQRGELWNDAESPQALRDAFERLKPRCLGFQSVR